LPQIRPFSIETELLAIYPAELRFPFHEEDKYISLTNKTDDDVVYAINDDGWEDKDYYMTQRRTRLTLGVVPPRSTCAVLVPYQPYLGVMMISGSRRYRTGDSLRFKLDKRDELMDDVRAEGGNAHEAVLACSRRVPHPVRGEVLCIFDHFSVYIPLRIDLVSSVR
jgi:hypothetical protein